MKQIKKLLILLLSLVVIANFTLVPSAATEGTRQVRFEFTSDMHSHIDISSGNINGQIRERGGMSRLSTLLNKFGTENSLYLDGGDFSQGTLYQTAYLSDASELRLLADASCDAATIGNHEWDLAGKGFGDMLNTAMEKSSKLPPLLCANLDFSGKLTEEQQYVKDTLDKYVELSGQDSIANTIITMPNGVKVGLFGIAGEESIADSPTSGMKWLDGIEAATEQVNYLKGKCDIIVCISHSGLDETEEGEDRTGEDIDLAEACPDINLIISGHSHTFLFKPVKVGDTVIVASGEYLAYMGHIDANINANGKVTFENYKLEAVDEKVEQDTAIQAKVNAYRLDVDNEYLSKYGLKTNQVIAYSPFNFTSLADMYATHDEYPMGDLIADSYMYEARKNGIDDIDVALVGLGTIRGSFNRGDITVADAFEMCSLGAGKDNSAGHPLLTAYITGQELKLLVELDASLGPLVSSIKMSYAGLEYEFNTKRALLDRTTTVHLVREDGTRESIKDDQLYKVCCNMYAANMLGMLNGLTKGILKIVPKDIDGNAIEDFYDCELTDNLGREMKEWFAFADYLSSFEKNDDGVSVIPEVYADKQGRKVKYERSGLAVITHPGTTTIVFMIIIIVVIFGGLWLANRRLRKRIRKNREERRKNT